MADLIDDKITLKLNSPITEEQWDDITDVDFEHTDRIWFETKHGKKVEFVKPSAQPEITDGQAISHLQSTGWMQNHDHVIYESGLRDGLADDSGSYDSLIPAERKVGKWIKMSDADGMYYCCSECGEELYRKWSFDREFDLFPKKESIDMTNYCPNCGARMMEEQDANGT